MKQRAALWAVAIAVFFMQFSYTAQAQTPVRALIVYDAPAPDAYEKLGFAYAIMLKNLLGHFDGQVDLVPVQNYTAGKIEQYTATFYLGSYYDNPIPTTFLSDVVATQKTVVWFKYNLWQIAWDASYNFSQRYGLGFNSLRGLDAAPSGSNPNPGFFDTILYKGKSFVKYYAYDSGSGIVHADPDVGLVQILDTAKAASQVTIKDSKTGEQVPYITRSGNFWYFADMPFSYIGPRDRYLVLTDILHDILGINHAVSHRALVRLEDVGALVSVSAMKKLTDYLYQKHIPFTIATIPHYLDPLGKYNDNIPEEVPMSQATNLKTSLNYALPRGAQIVMHGYTHQYDSTPNKYTAVSGDDYEFWNAVQDTPVAEDSTAWAAGRLQAGLNELTSNGYTPIAWEAPHYQSSPLSMRAVPPLFNTTYQRVVYYTSDTPNLTASQGKDFAVGQFFPYVIKKDYYGQRIIPENLGNIEYDISAIDPTSNITYTWQDIYTNAQYALTVRDGVASFFFHPFWLEPDVNTPGFQDFKSLVSGITALGYGWSAPTSLP
jgi:uncharacterized protein YdaL